MSALEGAQKSLASIMNEVYPDVVAANGVYLPDDLQDWQNLAAKNVVFIRVRPPQLVEPGIFSTFAAYIDICHRQYRTARQKADALVDHLISANARNPKTSITPTVYPMEGEGYWVMNVRFVLKVKSS